MLDFLSSVFGVLVLGTLLFLSIFSYIWLTEYRLDRRAKRFNLVRRFAPSDGGNYPAFFDPASGTFAAFTPGNKPVAEQLLFVHGQTKPLTPERPIVLNAPGSTHLSSEQVAAMPVQRVHELPAGQKFEAEHNVATPEQADSAMTLDEIGAALAEAKAQGIPKTKAIPAITGLKRGGGQYQIWNEMWDNL